MREASRGALVVFAQSPDYSWEGSRGLLRASWRRLGVGVSKAAIGGSSGPRRACRWPSWGAPHPHHPRVAQDGSASRGRSRGKRRGLGTGQARGGRKRGRRSDFRVALRNPGVFAFSLCFRLGIRVVSTLVHLYSMSTWGDRGAALALGACCVATRRTTTTASSIFEVPRAAALEVLHLHRQWRKT